MIPIPIEEYFENEVCMDCYSVLDYPIYFHVPGNHTPLILCESCSFGLYQCARCRHIVSHLDRPSFREMVYTGLPDTFYDEHIFCRECAHNVPPLQEDDDDDTDVEDMTTIGGFYEMEMETQPIY